MLSFIFQWKLEAGFCLEIWQISHTLTADQSIFFNTECLSGVSPSRYCISLGSVIVLQPSWYDNTRPLRAEMLKRSLKYILYLRETTYSRL